MPKSIVQEYWQGVAERLQVEANQMNSHSGHRGEIGRANEVSLSHLLTNLIPSGFGVGSGVIFNSKDERSNQTDLVVYNTVEQPRILAQTTQMLYPVETVAAAVEIKTRLTKEEVRTTGEKVQAAKALLSATDKTALHYSLFGYSCGNSHPRTIAAEINALPPEQQPDSVCILNPALFGNSREGQVVDLVPVHLNDADGAPVSRSWQVVGREHGDGKAFPAVNLEPGRSTRKVVTEPGRALLLYADSLIDHLTQGARWLSAYLPPVSREVFRPEDCA